MKRKMSSAIVLIENKILLVRNQKVILDRDLAELYGVETKYLNRQVRRNKDRFPKEFMFQLMAKEKKELVTNWRRFETMKHTTTKPYAFTEHGALMVAAVLNSPKAITVSIFIVKVFIKIREILSTHLEIAEKLAELEKRIDTNDSQITALFDTITDMLEPPAPPKKQFGFQIQEKRVKNSPGRK